MACGCRVGRADAAKEPRRTRERTESWNIAETMSVGKSLSAADIRRAGGWRPTTIGPRKVGGGRADTASEPAGAIADPIRSWISWDSQILSP